MDKSAGEFKLVCPLEKGDVWMVVEGVGIIIANPERAPLLVRDDGTREPLIATGPDTYRKMDSWP